MNRIRYVPEVASKPDRIEKDLANAKLLASILEEEAMAIRQFNPSGHESSATNGDTKPVDTVMSDAHADREDDAEPKESGSDAIERRIEKIMADLREQGVVVDEKVMEAKKVRGYAVLLLLCSP